MSSICFPVTGKELYRVHLLKTIKKTDMEMVYLDRQIKKTDLEILLLERELRWVRCHGETGEYVVGTILQILTVAFVLVGNKEEPKHVNLSCILFVIVVNSSRLPECWSVDDEIMEVHSQKCLSK